MTSKSELHSEEQSLLVDVYWEIARQMRQDLLVDEYFITSILDEMPFIDEKEKLRGKQYNQVGLVDLKRDLTCGIVTCLCAGYEDDDSYILKFDTQPQVEPNDSHYYDPAAIRILSRGPSIFFDMELPTEFDEHELLNYKKKMVFGLKKGSPTPVWQSFGAPLGQDGMKIGNYEPISQMLSDKEADDNFFFSAVQGRLPGFMITSKDEVYFEFDELRSFMPTQLVWRNTNFIPGPSL